MSVIFETLQKLNHSPEGSEAGEDAARPRRNVYALRTVLMSPVSVVLLTALVFGLGYGLVSGLRYLQRSARLNPDVLAVAETVTVPVASADAAQTVPPPPDMRQSEAAIGDPAAPIDATPIADAPVFTGPEVPPPPTETMAQLSEAGPDVTGVEGWQLPSAAAAPAFAPAAMAPEARSQGGFIGGDGEPIAAHMAFAPETPPQPAADAAQLQAVTAAPSAGPAYPVGISPAASAPHGDWTPTHTLAAVPAISADHFSGLAPSPAAPELAPATAPETHVAPPFTRKAIPRYTRLVNRLQIALTDGDARTTERLLGDFADAKGQRHPYLLKLKAYRRLQAKDFAAAEALLSEVLALDASDRDAQTNMVVVEANTGRLEAARQRMARLAERFPEDEALAAMRRRLN